MVVEFFLIAIVILIAFAIFDLIVGVSNDAANFLNSSLGSKVAPRHVIMIVACFGILAGVYLFSLVGIAEQVFEVSRNRTTRWSFMTLFVGLNAAALRFLSVRALGITCKLQMVII